MEAIELAQQQGNIAKNEAAEILALLGGLEVKNDADQDYAADVLRDVKAKGKVVDEMRKTITEPLNAALRAANGFFKPAIEAYGQAERIMKSKIAGYLVAKDAANRAALAVAAKADTPEEAKGALAAITPAAPPTGVSVRTIWKFEVTDADKVPREYCSPDLKKIAAAQPGTVPGVRFFQDQVVASRRI